MATHLLEFHVDWTSRQPKQQLLQVFKVQVRRHLETAHSKYATTVQKSKHERVTLCQFRAYFILIIQYRLAQATIADRTCRE